MKRLFVHFLFDDENERINQLWRANTSSYKNYFTSVRRKEQLINIRKRNA